jgi:UDPglucose 6-dehydrogenase
MNLTIVGYGFVGKAVEHSFKQCYDLYVVDPRYNKNRISDRVAAGIIVCVGTPAREDGTCDSSAIEAVFADIPESVPVLIKSTVALENFEQLVQRFPNHRITLSPEFLRAATANEDFAAQQYVILGGGAIDFWLAVFRKRFPDIHYLTCAQRDAILIKYAENSFFAVKVGFFNHLREISRLIGADFETVRHHLTRDTRIGPDHSYVPGPDNCLGWGGHCLPKDTDAMLHTARQHGYTFEILEAAVSYNKKIRKFNTSSG